MRSKPDALTPEAWILHLFSAKTARSGGIVRRNRRDIERIVGWPVFEAELRRRGYRAILNGGQVIIVCNLEPLVLIGG